MCVLMVYLAQTRAAGPAPGGAGGTVNILVWVGALIVSVIVLGLAVMYVRARALSGHKLGSSDGGIETLRELRQRGQITQEEYERARTRLVARLSGQGLAAGKPSQSAPPAPPV